MKGEEFYVFAKEFLEKWNQLFKQNPNVNAFEWVDGMKGGFLKTCWKKNIESPPKEDEPPFEGNWIELQHDQVLVEDTNDL
jgi:hypothetical protein